MTVSPATDQALRNAMNRLLTGRARRTDGKLIKANLYREAEVSRATMNRAHEILIAWDQAVATRTGHPSPAGTSDEQAALRTKLSRKTSECADLQQRLNAAATTIAALHHDNHALRGELARHEATNIAAIA
ncbi:hypothetical protein ACGFJ7_35155 [Actinoplanes sp. NPDC048988]|uniref:hypothetical protein n=1 Tax=Actinoplanes sp. NPDC048988 TaxID=3363901 RepID=UPI003717F15D